MKSDEDKEKKISNFYIERIFNMFLLKLDIMEYELGDFIDRKRNKHYYIYLSIYNSLLLVLGLMFVVFFIYENQILRWIADILIIFSMIFQNKFLRKFPYNHSRYRYERKTTKERLEQFELILNSNSLAKDLVTQNYSVIFKDIKERINYYSSFFKPKRFVLREIGIIAILTSLITRIIYDIIASFLLFISSPSSEFQFDLDIFINIILFILFFIIVFLLPYFSNRKIALAGEKEFNKAFKIDFYLRIFREFTKMLNFIFKTPDYIPALLEIEGASEVFKNSKSKFLDNALEKINDLE